MSRAKQVEWRKATPSPIVLAFGPESYFVGRVIRSVREQLKESNPGLEVQEIEAADYRGGQLLELTSPSLFAEPKLVVIRSVEKCTDELIEDGIAYLENPSSDATVIFTHSGATVRGKKLLEAMRLNSRVTEALCSKPKNEQYRSEFVAAEFAEAGRPITPGAVRALVSAFGENFIELASACSQLCQDSAATITEEIVDSYYGGRVETTSWKIAEAAASGNSAVALALLRHALASGQDAVLIVGAVSKTIRDLVKLHGNPSATAASLGMHPWALEKSRKNLVGWSDEGFAVVINAIVDADAAAKGAYRDPNFVLERLLILIASKGRQ